MNPATHSSKSSTVQCAICFEDLKDQEIGIPELCEHAFCFTCLVKWTKTQNSCPIDRQIFQYIFKKHNFSRCQSYAKVNINNTQLEIYIEKKPISCDACDNDDYEYNPLLICAQCNSSYHEFCLNTFDTSIWMCPSCGYTHEERTENDTKSMKNSLMLRRPTARIRSFALRDQDRTLPVARPLRRLQQSVRQNPIQKIENLIPRNISSTQEKNTKNNSLVRSVITPDEAARRISASGIPVVSNPRSTALISQVKNMAALKRKRKQFVRLPPRIPVTQLARIPRRTDAPLRPRSKIITQKSNSSASASFIDKLLHSQKQLYSLEHIQMQGAHINLS